MSVAVGKCCRASTGFMSTNKHDASSIGNRNTTSSTSLTASNQAMTCEALLHGSPGQKDIMPRYLPRGLILLESPLQMRQRMNRGKSQWN